uniref:Uncharacterized protein n=1 Tax=Pristionchus pacificus TaxID=54126 RepID=A0A454XVB9_PRIPA|eukprot:PDM73701.1 hypothetical protein PRIPAC_41057 [Pristionchus pacificus]
MNGFFILTAHASYSWPKLPVRIPQPPSLYPLQSACSLGGQRRETAGEMRIVIHRIPRDPYAPTQWKSMSFARALERDGISRAGRGKTTDKTRIPTSF